MSTGSNPPAEADDPPDAPSTKHRGPGPVDDDRVAEAHDTLAKSRATADDQADDPDPS